MQPSKNTLPSRLALLPLLACGLSLSGQAMAQEKTPPPSASLVIEAGTPAGKVSPTHYGLMTEEINYCYDGGLYAELVRNRAFLDDAQKPAHWSAVQGATITLDPKQPLNEAIPTSLRLDVATASPTAPAGVSNEGYWGIPVKPETRYHARFNAKAADGFNGPLTVSIVSEDGATTYAKAEAQSLTGDWKSYDVVLTTGKVTATTKARLSLTVDKPGTVWLGLVSLFPPTWKDRPNGLRPDLMQMLVDLKPAFLRFPGGNYLEGETPETRFEWKKTLGPISQRGGHQGTWGYRSTDGMGLMEFLQWTEDMGAEPVLALYAGYSLKGAFIKPGADLEPYLQEALEEIEYVTGPVGSKWGAQRAKDGHPAPFKLRYVEIGNEDGFDKSLSYDGRFTQFADAIRKTYPTLKCISSVGGDQPANLRVHSRKPDVLDEHYYRNTEAFLKDSPAHFESYDRKGPEIFVGEWAAHETSFPPWDQRSRGLPATPAMKAAIGDAAWMAAMERNSDIVTMQCYAPLFANVNEYQWRPDLIGYDALHAFGSPSYYAIKMFSRNVGDSILKSTFTGGDLQGTVTRDSKTGATFVKIVNPQASEQALSIEFKGTHAVSTSASVETLAAVQDATNSIVEPTNVVPVKSAISGVKPTFTYTLPAYSITVLQLKTK
ncbi:MAG: alpha-L-arabinofuranosidase C-terminal domain-containing protein [Luteolibacter sp.]